MTNDGARAIILGSFVASAATVIIADLSAGSVPSGRQVLAGGLLFGGVSLIASAAPAPAAALAGIIATATVLNYGSRLFGGVDRITGGQGPLTHTTTRIGPGAVTAAGSAAATSGGASATPSPVVGAPLGPLGAMVPGALARPFASGAAVSVERTDRGQDFGIRARTPVSAIASGTVAAIYPSFGPPNERSWTAIRLDRPIGGARYYYVGGGTPIVRVGQRVGAGEQVGIYSAGQQAEIGLWNDLTSWQSSKRSGGPSGELPTPLGAMFSRLLAGLMPDILTHTPVIQ